MGTRSAPTIANLVMGDFEVKHVYTYPKQPFLWIHFIDDNIGIWLHGLRELQEFFQIFKLMPQNHQVHFWIFWNLITISGHKYHHWARWVSICYQCTPNPLTHIPISHISHVTPTIKRLVALTANCSESGESVPTTQILSSMLTWSSNVINIEDILTPFYSLHLTRSDSKPEWVY